MYNATKFLDLLIFQYANWLGDEKKANLIEKTLVANQQEPFFREVVLKFKALINSADFYNPWRYERQSLLPYSYVKTLFSHSYRVGPTPAFIHLNNIIDKCLASVPAQNNSNSIFKVVSGFLIDSANFVLKNKSAVILLSFVFMASRVQASEINKKEVGFNLNSYGMSLKENTLSFPCCDANSLLLNVESNDQNYLDEKVIRKVLFDKVILDKKLSAKLTLKEKLAKRNQQTDLILFLAEDKFFAKNLEQLIWSESFKIIITDDFSENPYAVGLYDIYRNHVAIVDETKWVCPDSGRTKKHEFHHASIANKRSDNAPRKKCQEVDKQECHKLAQPFTSIEEQEELVKAIKQGNNRIFSDLTTLHNKWLEGKLKKREQLNRYERYKISLKDYQPRCILRFISQEASNYRLILQQVKALLPVNIEDKMLYPLHFEPIDGGIIIYANLVPHIETIENKIAAFVKDTHYVNNNWIKMYSSYSFEDQLKELDAETCANSNEIIEAFYPELLAYHETHNNYGNRRRMK